jgi:hypothetical protein
MRYIGSHLVVHFFALSRLNLHQVNVFLFFKIRFAFFFSLFFKTFFFVSKKKKKKIGENLARPARLINYLGSKYKSLILELSFLTIFFPRPGANPINYFTRVSKGVYIVAWCVIQGRKVPQRLSKLLE